MHVSIPPMGLDGHLRLCQPCVGVVVFAHGSGSSRYSPRNRFVADVLGEGRIATLLFDLLSEAEALDRSAVFDIGLLARRLAEAISWLRQQDAVGDLPIGLFGASTGAAAALTTASLPGADIAALVSRGGRPDLAGSALPKVRAPSLFIVGGSDTEVLALNRMALEQMRCERALQVIPGASHLFEEPGALEKAADLARGWFVRHFSHPCVA